MKIKLSTEALKLATSKASKGAGNLSMLTITSALTLESVEGNLILTTTTNSHNLEVKIKDVTSKDNKFFACTDCELFTKLVSKTDTENIILEVTENALMFTGNGVYNLPLIQDEEGTMARITPIEVDALEEVTVSSMELKKLLTWNKLAVAKTLEEPIFTGYCVKDNKIFTYNNITVCVSRLKLDKVNMLIPSGIVNLFSLFEDKNVTVKTTNNKVSFATDDVVITGALLEGFDLYPTEQLSALVDGEDFKNKVKISKNKFSNMLDRLGLFVQEDKNEIVMSFGKDKLVVSDKGSSVGEQISYIGTTESPNFECKIDLNDIKGIIGEISGEEVCLLYGSDVGICVYNDNMNYIIPLLTDSEDEEE